VTADEPMNPSAPPCGNKECDLCYPLPRWNARRVVVLRREYFGEIKAPTLEEAHARVEDLWSGGYAQTGVEAQPAVIEPLDQESLAWHAKYGAEWCFHTIRARDAKKPERFPRPVVCEWCKNRFRAIFFDETSEKQTQGDDCASTVYQKDGEWYVAGCYGSGSFDMHRLRFIANCPTEPLDPVCDQCIAERVAAGDLVNDGRLDP